MDDRLILLHGQDNVAIARQGMSGADGEMIPAGHKVAIRGIRRGKPVQRYGQVIGVATADIRAGAWVHSHNLSAGDLAPLSNPRIELVDPEPLDPILTARTFKGYQRGDGQVGTRNILAVMSTVNCSAHAALEIAHHFTPERLAGYPNVDGVVALTHASGCAMAENSLAFRNLQRVLANTPSNPNIGGALMIGLGCETNHVDRYCDAGCDVRRMAVPARGSVPLLTIQDSGGLRRVVEAGIAAMEDLLQQANRDTRVPVPLEHLRIALQCGGSDGWSGVTANPLVGRMCDRVVRAGGSVVLAETPEIFGAEQLLTQRALSRAMAEALIGHIHAWQERAARFGFSIDNNPTPGNKAGGLTTILEKSLGAVAKGGSTPLAGVVGYAEPVTSRGLTFMDSPGYDPVSITGEIAGGCNLVVFTTGRGSTYGGYAAPCIKVTSNSLLYRRMEADMDYDAGALLDGKDPDQAADELFEMVIQAASGAPTKAEAQGWRESEFAPWISAEML